MDLNKLIEIVDEGYPDGYVKRCFENPKKDHGDTLALFLAREIKSTFDENATDKDQIEEVMRVLDAARRELGRVLDTVMMVRFTKTGNAVR